MQMIFEYVISPVLVAGVSYVVWLLKDQRKHNRANDMGMALLLRRQIIADHKEYCINGEPMTAGAYDDIVEVHNTYKALGGNGLTDKMFDELAKIEIAEGK